MQELTHTFIAYIDECGNEGFTFRPYPDRGSSEWMILSAVIFRREQSQAFLKAYGKFRDTHRKQDNWNFHFVRASHDERIGFLNHMLDTPLTATNVLTHKPSLTNREAFSQQYILYFYTMRLLLERVSWFCRDHYDPFSDNAPNKVKLVFSDRRGLSKERLISYLDLIRTSKMITAGGVPVFNTNCSIDWNHIDLKLIDVQPHKTQVGLQIADLAVSSVGRAVEYSDYGTTEHRYVKMLKPAVYKGQGYFQCGMKFFPRPPTGPLRNEPRFHWLHHYK